MQECNIGSLKRNIVMSDGRAIVINMLWRYTCYIRIIVASFGEA